MLKHLTLKEIDAALFVSVMFCALMIVIPVNNTAVIAERISRGSLLFAPRTNLISVLNYLFNVLMFVPVAIFTCLKFSRVYTLVKTKKLNYNGLNIAPIEAFAFCAMLSIAFESFQLLLTYRVTDLDDFLLNSLGALFGIVILQLGFIKPFQEITAE